MNVLNRPILSWGYTRPLMKKYLVAIHHPDDYDPSVAEDALMSRDIDALNDEMKAAGVMASVVKHDSCI